MKRSRLQHRFHPVGIIFTAICGGALQGIVSVQATSLHIVVDQIAGIFGAVVGFVTAPALFLAAWRKDWRLVIPAVYIPSLMSAWIASDKYNPFLGALWAIMTFVVSCIFCHFFIPKAKPTSINCCMTCGYDLTGLLRNSKCPECGESVASIMISDKLSTNRLFVRLIPFLLIPVASVGFHSVFSPPDLPTASIAELTASLATNDAQLSYEASQELAFRGMESILQVVDHNNANVRRSVASALRWVHHEDTAAVITTLLNDEDTYVRMEAIAAIQFNIRPSLRHALENRLQIEKNTMVKGRLQEAINYLRGR